MTKSDMYAFKAVFFASIACNAQRRKRGILEGIDKER